VEDKFLDISGLSKYLNIPKGTVYKLSKKGDIPSCKIGKQLRFRKSSIDKWITLREESSTVEAVDSRVVKQKRLFSKNTLKRVLLIDDDELVLKSTNRLLKRYKYDIVAVERGKDAVQKVKDEHFDLLIVDVMMPDLNGIETIKRIRRTLKECKKPAIPELIITGYADSSAERDIMKLGISDIVYKPFLISEFLKIIVKKMEKPK